MILGICGRAQHGKDTLGKMLADELYDRTGQKYILMAYATELKRKVQKDFDLSYEQLWGMDKETYDFRYPKHRGPAPMCLGNRNDGKDIGQVMKERQHWTAREILQDYGQFFRTIDNNFWVKALFKVIDEKEYNNAIITDVRHVNEVDAVKNRGGYVINIVRNIETGVHNQNHISETALDDYKADFVVKNFGSLDDLWETSKQLVEVIITKVLDSFSEIKIIGGKNGKK